MREFNEKLNRETDAAFAAASILLNLLIVLILSFGFWAFYSLISRPETIELVLRESFRL